MLAVFASRQAVKDALASVQSSSSNETKSTMVIACYNSETSQVVSGDSASVARLESHLCSPTVPGQQPLKFLRVDTSHGFHSCLVDPILEELDQVSSSLEWRTPTIPIEVCSPDPSPGRWAALAPYSPSSHARNPVFFADAVHRLEQRLGRCVWLEAGIDTPIVSMTKRAASQLDGHSFYAVSTKGVDAPVNVIPHAVCHVWSCSADVTHWSFLQADSPPNAVWLPPYAFDHTVAWLDNIDRAAKLQRKLNKCGAQAPIHSEAACPEKRNMVTLLHAGDKPEMKRFRVSFEGERLQTIVLGHAVRNRPLCPASVYLECVTMALDLLTGHENPGQSSLEFKDLDIQAPLGVAAVNVELVLHDLTANCQWEFSVISRHPERPGRTTLHAKGRVTMSPEGSNLDATARLASRQMKTVEASEAAERMLSRRAYRLFSRVVNYETFLEGIASITINGNEDVATIAISASQPGVEDSTVVRTATPDGVGKSEVMVCTGVKSSTIVKGCNMTDCGSWKVYASYTPTSAFQAVGDVFAWSEDGSIAATFTGCRFAKLDMVRLEKLLDPVNCIVSRNQGDSTESFLPEMAEISCPKAAGLADPRRDITPPETPPLSIKSSLRQVLETYTGFPASSMVDDAVIADLGLDSLAATELASELQTANGDAIDGNELLSMTIHQLDQKLYGHVASKLLADFPRTASHIPGDPDKAVYTPTKTDDERISGSETPSPQLEKKTVVYKEVDGVQIEADIFLPAVAPAQPMAIALMIHGGGHMTLSRHAVRPAQTAYLAVNGVLPVSLDYRLCPEINIIDGAMEDVRDAVTWARLTLPLISANKNISLDTERIVVIGWSTGGHLAMSTAWTVEAAGELPPKAILSFYAPTNFLAKDVFPPRQIPTPVLPYRRMSREDILRTAVSANPITNYDMHGQEDLELGWVKSGDSRSELLLSLFESGSREFGLSLILNGSPGGHKTVGELVANPPSLERQAAICPTARLRMGQYKVPTFIIHGESDDIALFESAANLYDEMKQQGTPSGFLAVDHSGHLHDLHLKVGMPQWDRYIVPGYQFLFDMLKK
ncbi:polyketide synthase [Metarhizium anisopliae]|nr:polyketide synthase [Metarhizium anisopliae]